MATTYDLIIVGLGPAGAALGHRAQARGLKVLGIDPQTRWVNTFGLFRDELPDWLSDIPVSSRSFPTARALRTHQLAREYVILDNDALRRRLLTFEVIQGHAEIQNSTRVQVGPNSFTADVVVDARGARMEEGMVAQQALGWFVTEPIAPNWLDFDPRTGQFRYSFPTKHGTLVEQTLLATREVVDWDCLAAQLEADLDEKPRAVEKVVIPLSPPQPTLSALPFGARAGFINPITGFSLATSFRMVDPTLDALWPKQGDHPNQLPFRTWQFRVDRALCTLIQSVLLELSPARLAEVLDVILGASIKTQRGFLGLGDPIGTLWGMMRVFVSVPLGTKVSILRVLAAQIRRAR
ncbi:lycopene cyclase family protein [Corynebacterium epidermidicanis]|uniref:Lycopene cyclase protein n=1 Tax=Corynebacterium epidermidicanis TaxID=1050174 RepID=A0A0G3GRK5_9CORY|nr:lycopene cyclase family protein [Corynebacterium epidermidicanis]AKK03190.1 Lycopene cyclase protein [Corynebacterium epidermidicanis]